MFQLIMKLILFKGDWWKLWLIAVSYFSALIQLILFRNAYSYSAERRCLGERWRWNLENDEAQIQCNKVSRAVMKMCFFPLTNRWNDLYQLTHQSKISFIKQHRIILLTKVESSIFALHSSPNDWPLTRQCIFLCMFVCRLMLRTVCTFFLFFFFTSNWLFENDKSR